MGKKKRRVFLCRGTLRVKVKSKVILTSFPKIHGKETFVGAKDGRLVELVVSEAPPRSKIGRERRAKEMSG